MVDVLAEPATLLIILPPHLAFRVPSDAIHSYIHIYSKTSIAHALCDSILPQLMLGQSLCSCCSTRSRPGQTVGGFTAVFLGADDVSLGDSGLFRFRRCRFQPFLLAVGRQFLPRWGWNLGRNVECRGQIHGTVRTNRHPWPRIVGPHLLDHSEVLIVGPRRWSSVPSFEASAASLWRSCLPLACAGTCANTRVDVAVLHSLPTSNQTPSGRGMAQEEECVAEHWSSHGGATPVVIIYDIRRRGVAVASASGFLAVSDVATCISIRTDNGDDPSPVSSALLLRFWPRATETTKTTL